MKRTVSIALAIVAVIVAFVAGVTVRPGSASATNTSSTTTVAATGTGAASHKNSSRDGETLQQRYTALVGAVAAKASISESTLDSAIRSVAEDKIAAAEQAGRIKPAAANKLETALKNDTLGTLLQHRSRMARVRPFLRLFHLLTGGNGTATAGGATS